MKFADRYISGVRFDHMEGDLRARADARIPIATNASSSSRENTRTKSGVKTRRRRHTSSKTESSLFTDNLYTRTLE